MILEYMIEDNYKWIRNTIGGELVRVYGPREGLSRPNGDQADVEIGEKIGRFFAGDEHLQITNTETGVMYPLDVLMGENGNLYARTKIGSVSTTWFNWGFFHITQADVVRLRELDKKSKAYSEIKRWVFKPESPMPKVKPNTQCTTCRHPINEEDVVYATRNDGSAVDYNRAKHIECAIRCNERGWA